ncbi:MAG: hypothetical protein V3V00_14040 [Saprospiraceae bacterium]
MKKLGKIALGLCGIVIIGLVGLYVVNQPPSIKYLKEHPEEFRFENYWSNNQAQTAINELFSTRTSKKDLDSVFINGNGFKESVPWINTGTTTQVVKEPITEDYNIFYFRADKENIRKGYFVIAVFTRDHSLKENLIYGYATGKGGFTFLVNMLVGAKGEGNE